jgi:hypothetical protein
MGYTTCTQCNVTVKHYKSHCNSKTHKENGKNINYAFNVIKDEMEGEVIHTPQKKKILDEELLLQHKAIWAVGFEKLLETYTTIDKSTKRYIKDNWKPTYEWCPLEYAKNPFKMLIEDESPERNKLNGIEKRCLTAIMKRFNETKPKQPQQKKFKVYAIGKLSNDIMKQIGEYTGCLGVEICFNDEVKKMLRRNIGKTILQPVLDYETSFMRYTSGKITKSGLKANRTRLDNKNFGINKYYDRQSGEMNYLVEDPSNEWMLRDGHPDNKLYTKPKYYPVEFAVNYMNELLSVMSNKYNNHGGLRNEIGFDIWNIKNIYKSNKPIIS